MNEIMSEKLQKVLARAGLGSRRLMEQWIAQGRIQVDGKLATLGVRVDRHSLILVDGQQLAHQTSQVNRLPKILLYHKPRGEVCTRHDPQGRPSVFRHFPKLSQRPWILVGRLDINTSGLLLVTDQGELANKLMHPSSEIEREYLVRVFGNVTNHTLKHLQEGVMLAEGLAKFKKITKIREHDKQHWYRVVLMRGLNREVRRIWETQGLSVSRLSRIRYGMIELPKQLKPGDYQLLDKKSVQALISQV